ncbi:MAG: hypothetical protein H3C54_01475 [Taibaiella sp.]|nr:hypothetical protein [Taibaiella sp.]
MHPIVDRIIVVEQQENWIYYCGDMRIPLNDFDGLLPGKITMCRVVSYRKETATLLLKVENRTPLNKHHYQISTEANKDIFIDNPVEKIVLNDVYWQASIKRNHDIPSKQKDNIELYDYGVEFEESIEDLFKEPETKERNISLKKTKQISELVFEDGSLSFLQYCTEIGKEVTFKIHHAFIRKEFDSIKPYFSKLFKKGKIEVICNLIVSGDTVIETRAVSDDIQQINEGTLTQIEDDLIADSILGKETDEIRSLEDAFNSSFPELENKSVEWLMSKIAQEQHTRHYKHLLHLSHKHDRSLVNLKVTGRPVSFLFGIRCEKGIYIVWETYNTKEATYVWKYEKDTQPGMKEFIAEIDDEIKKLRQGTKREYRTLNKANPNFCVIEHDYSSPDSGFKKWEDTLNAFLY